MLTWKKFLESKKDIEREEEETGIDLDNDGEEGESAEHKRKINATRKKKGLGDLKGNTAADVDDEESEEIEQERE